MDRRAKGIIAVLGMTVAILVAALAVVIAQASDDDDEGMSSGMGGNASYMGMMQAMGNMDSDAMLTHMREVLGDDGYQRMLQHFQDDRSGMPMTGNTAIDSMMHQMMDGMMQQMPDDSGSVLPRATSTPTPTPR